MRPARSSCEGARSYRDALVRRAREFAETLCVGRTHGVHAEPTTFGLRLASFAFEADRNVARLSDAFEQVAVGKLSGAVGTYASVPPSVETRVMEALGLASEDVSTQVVPRDRHAVVLARIAIAGGGAGALRDRDPQPAANRGPRGGGAVRLGAEGLIGDAAQAQPHPRRADSAAWPGSCAATPRLGLRTSPSGTSGTSPTQAPSGWCCPTRPSPSTTCSTSPPGSSTG